MRNPFKKVLLILIPAAFLATACSEAPQAQSSATEAVPPQEQQAGNQAALSNCPSSGHIGHPCAISFIDSNCKVTRTHGSHKFNTLC